MSCRPYVKAGCDFQSSVKAPSSVFHSLNASAAGSYPIRLEAFFRSERTSAAMLLTRLVAARPFLGGIRLARQASLSYARRADRLCLCDLAHRSSKLEAERSIIELVEKHAMTWCIVRPPLVYGPNARGLVQLIARGTPFARFSDSQAQLHRPRQHRLGSGCHSRRTGSGQRPVVCKRWRGSTYGRFYSHRRKYMGRNVTLIPVPALVA
jgi:hypothetical protein